ncbi:hypothetical protein ACHHYP_10964 [Achlya hypogyna]|uniref:PX domain-containing protein n=1 Tax=Achlya hypogyna TaxID=1202772 RepID=A0A1V9YK55_ACHHY|nr:hypothetical protein ACHHYP_10964 [Achlya hypogyna]
MGCTQSSTVDENVQIATIESVAVAPPSTSVQVSTVDDVVVATETKSYTISSTSVDGSGVVLYHVETDGIIAKKRFNDFKVFHAELTTVVQELPPLPASGLATVFKRTDEKLIAERSARFQLILDAAAANASDRLAQFVAAAVAEEAVREVVAPEPVAEAAEPVEEVIVSEEATEVPAATLEEPAVVAAEEVVDEVAAVVAEVVVEEEVVVATEEVVVVAADVVPATEEIIVEDKEAAIADDDVAAKETVSTDAPTPAAVVEQTAATEHATEVASDKAVEVPVEATPEVEETKPEEAKVEVEVVVIEKKYTIPTHSVEANVVVYHIEGEGHSIKKRYNDFKVFHAELKDVEGIPALPSAGIASVFKRRDEKLIAERIARFEEILNAAAHHAADRVEKFVTPAPEPEPVVEAATTEEAAPATEEAAPAVEAAVAPEAAAIEVAAVPEVVAEPAAPVVAEAAAPVVEEAPVDIVAEVAAAEAKPETEVKEEKPVVAATTEAAPVVA